MHCRYPQTSSNKAFTNYQYNASVYRLILVYFSTNTSQYLQAIVPVSKLFFLV